MLMEISSDIISFRQKEINVHNSVGHCRTFVDYFTGMKLTCKYPNMLEAI